MVVLIKNKSDITKSINKEKVAEFTLSDERTILSKQRTELAFMQTGIAMVGLGFVVLKFWLEYPIKVAATLLVGLGFYEIARSYQKLLEYNRRLERIKTMVRKSKWGKIEYGGE